MTVSNELINLYQKNPGYFSGARPEMLKFFPDSATRVLDVGCGEGNFGALLKQGANCEVWGTELSNKAAEIANAKLDKVLAGDIFDQLTNLPNNYFDVIYFNDVLEHLVDPEALLKEVKCKLSSKGVVICSIPNILYYRALKSYVIDRDWRYEDSGVMDKTHLRFFTKKSILRMFRNCDYKIGIIKPINLSKSPLPYLTSAFTFGLIPFQICAMQFAVIVEPNTR